MAVSKLTILQLLTAAASLFHFMLPAPAAENIPVIQATQHHLHFGKMMAFVGKNELRLDNLGSWKFTLCSRAPKWDVFVYRTDDKTMFKQSYANFIKSGLLSEIAIGLRARIVAEPKLCKPAVVNGVPVMGYADRKIAVSFIAPSQFNPKIEQIIYLAYKMPTQGGFPLRYACIQEGKDFITGMDQTGRLQVQLSTSQVKRTTVPNAYFDCPPNLKDVGSVQDVLLAKGSRSQSDGIFQELMRDK